MRRLVAVAVLLMVGCSQDPEIAYKRALRDFEHADAVVEDTVLKYRDQRRLAVQQVVKDRLGFTVDEMKERASAISGNFPYDEAMKEYDKASEGLVAAHAIFVSCTTAGTPESSDFRKYLMSIDPDAAIACENAIEKRNTAAKKLDIARSNYLKVRPGNKR